MRFCTELKGKASWFLPFNPVAAVSVSVPLLRLKLPMLAAALARLATGSLEIARRLGAADDPALLRLADPAFALEALEERGRRWSWLAAR